jgi:hypothetical protein
MTQNQFIEEWLQLVIPQTWITANKDNFYKVTFIKDDPIIKRHGKWSYSESCLYKDDIPYVYRLNDIYIVNKTYRRNYQSDLHESFHKLNKYGYLFNDEFSFHQALFRIIQLVSDPNGFIDEIIVHFLSRLHFFFEDTDVQEKYVRIKEKYNL